MAGRYQTDMGGTHESFLTTQWSLIEHIQAGEDRDSVLIGSLLRMYWKPVYCYLRRKGYDNEQAKDLTQDFFHEVVLNRDLVGRADLSKGRFRTFLLHALNQYLINKNRDAHATKRIPRERLISLDTMRLPDLPQAIVESDAEDTYHYAWLSSLLERVISQVQTDCRREGMETHWALFDTHVLKPILGGESPPPLATLCREHGVDDPKKASNMIVTVKRRFRAALLEHIRGTVLSGDQADEELTDLLQFLPRGAQPSL
jgi:DNA-directed RNA polymerase specialized sigma24 family protein